jgi:hypothetical protein
MRRNALAWALTYDLPSMRPAPFERRLLAAMLDGLCFILMGMLVVGAVRDWLFDYFGRPTYRFTGIFGTFRPEDTFMLGMGVLLVVYSASEVVAATSVGKRACGMTIVRRGGTRAGRQRLFFRWFIKYGPLVFYVLVVGAEWVMFRASGFVLADHSRLAWHGARVTIGLLSVAWGVGWMISLILLVLPIRASVHDVLTGTGVFLGDEVREPTGGFHPVVTDRERSSPS